MVTKKEHMPNTNSQLSSFQSGCYSTEKCVGIHKQRKLEIIVKLTSYQIHVFVSKVVQFQSPLSLCLSETGFLRHSTKNDQRVLFTPWKLSILFAPCSEKQSTILRHGARIELKHNKAENNIDGAAHTGIADDVIV